MSFYGSSFSFDGVSCEEYGLMLYDFNTDSQGNSVFASHVEIEEDRIPGRIRSIFYGATQNDNLEFTLIFGADEESALNGEDIDRHEMEVLGSWLTGKLGYRWLTIDQPDMETVRYHCILTNLEMIEFAGYKWALKCTAHCDSPYGYRLPEHYTYKAQNNTDVILNCRSSHNDLYYPFLTIESIQGNRSIEIQNLTTGKTFKLESLPSGIAQITVNEELGILEADSGVNIYPYFNFVFLGLCRGDNHLRLIGNYTVTISCEFPANIGG